MELKLFGSNGAKQELKLLQELRRIADALDRIAPPASSDAVATPSSQSLATHSDATVSFSSDAETATYEEEEQRRQRWS